MKSRLLFLFTLLISLAAVSIGHAAESFKPVSKELVRITKSCANNSVFFKFTNKYEAPFFPWFHISEEASVDNILDDVRGAVLPRGDSQIFQMTFLDDKSAYFFGEVYLIKTEDEEITQDKIDQSCEFATYCQCNKLRCVTVILTNGVNCQLKVQDPHKERGTQSNPYIVVTK